MQIDAAVSEILRLEHIAIAREFTEIVVKSVNMRRFRKFVHDCFLDIKRTTLRLSWMLLIGTTLQQSFII